MAKTLANDAKTTVDMMEQMYLSVSDGNIDPDDLNALLAAWQLVQPRRAKLLRFYLNRTNTDASFASMVQVRWDALLSRYAEARSARQRLLDEYKAKLERRDAPLPIGAIIDDFFDDLPLSVAYYQRCVIAKELATCGTMEDKPQTFVALDLYAQRRPLWAHRIGQHIDAGNMIGIDVTIDADKFDCVITRRLTRE